MIIGFLVMFNQDGRTCKEEREREKERDRLLSLAGLCRLPSHDSVGMKWNKISNIDNCLVEGDY